MEISAIGTTKEAGLRTIVVALDADVESLRALDWVQHEFYKPGDILHMVHVCRCMSSPLEVFHGDTPILSFLHSHTCFTRALACNGHCMPVLTSSCWSAGVPGTTLHVADPSPHNESRELASAREFFMGRYPVQAAKHFSKSIIMIEGTCIIT